MTSAALSLLAARSLRLCWAGEDVFERGAVAAAAELLGLVVQRPSRLPMAGAQGGRRGGRASMPLGPVGPTVALTERRLVDLVDFLLDLRRLEELQASVNPPARAVRYTRARRVEVAIDTDSPGAAQGELQIAADDLVDYPGYGMCRVLELTERVFAGQAIPMAALERVRDGLKLTAMREKLSRIGRSLNARESTATQAANSPPPPAPPRPYPAPRQLPPSVAIARGPKPPPWGLRYVAHRTSMEDEDGRHIVLSPPLTFDGLLTYVVAPDGAWMTRFWLEPVSLAGGAVDLSGLEFELLEREFNAAGGAASRAHDDNAEDEEAAS